MSHANACLTPNGRLRLAQLVVDHGRDAMHDRSSRPHRSPRQTPTRRERRVLGLRVSRRWGPARIGYHLAMRPSTVHEILTRYGCPPLAWTDPDPATGTRTRGPQMSRRTKNTYVHDAPGDLTHVDIKKLGRIPEGGGWRFAGRGSAQDLRAHAARGKAARAGAPGSRGYAYIHHAVDDHSRLVYSEILTNEREETAVGFIQRARAWFAARGIIINAVLTDNGSCYRSKLWARTLAAAGIKHRRTRP